MSVIFDQLRISDDGKIMYVNMHVNRASYFDDVYMKSITVIPAMNSGGELQISETSPYTPTDNYIYHLEFAENTKEADLVLDKATLDAAFNNTDSEGEPIHEGATAKVSFGNNFSGNLYFVYVEVNGDMADPCVPCPMREDYVLGVTFDEGMLYQKMMGYTRELAATCTIPQGFSDLILQWNALKAAIETEHYIPAVQFFSTLFGNNGMTAIRQSKVCGCHG